MTCSKRIGWYSLALSCWVALWLLVDLSLVRAQDQPTMPEPSPSTISSSQTPTYTWDQLSSLSDQLLQSSNDLVNSAVTLNQKLDQLQLYLSESTTALQASVALRKQEEAAAQQTIQAASNSKLWWERSALVIGGAFVGYLIDKWPGAGIGAASGAVADAGLEIAFSFKLKL